MGKGFSSAPAWRIVLSYFALFYGVHRGAMGYLAFREGEALSLASVYVLQVLSAVFVFVAMRWRTRWIVPALVVAGVLLGTTALLGWGLGVLPPVGAASQLVVAILGTAGFAALVRMGLRDDESRQGRPPP